MKAIAFLGPSLKWAEAKELAEVELWPPARQGDVFKALALRPPAIALIDGVFDTQPSVWHHELIAAHACGVRVYGAASMGALRAAELPQWVTPVGRIAHAFARGDFVDDAWVAVLHAPAELDYRPMTVPHVNVWATVERAHARGRLSSADATAVLHTSDAQHYKVRTWRSVLAALPAPVRARVEPLPRVDLKAQDARACFRALRRALKPAPAHRQNFSAAVRRARLADPLPSGDARAGLATLLLARLAEGAGIVPDARRVAAWARRLPTTGWAEDQRLSAAHALALEELVLDRAQDFVADGPSAAEGQALDAMRAGAGR